MSRLVKILFFFAATSTTTFAGTMGPVCVEGNATIPCPHSGWLLGGEALYLQPTYSNVLVTSKFLSATSSTTEWNTLTPDWGWGFKLEGAYYYSTGSDINLNWYHYNQTTNNTLLITSPSLVSIAVERMIKPRWDAVNAEFGQRIKFGASKAIRFHGGAQYAQIISTFENSSTIFPPETLYMKFLGFGPRVGADMSYNWGRGLSVYANGAGALLISRSKFSQVTTGLTASTGTSYMPFTPAVIPELEGKLGAGFAHEFYVGTLNLDVGYLWQNYIHSQSFITLAGTNTSSDFMLNGLYFGLKWLG